MILGGISRKTGRIAAAAPAALLALAACGSPAIDTGTDAPAPTEATPESAPEPASSATTAIESTDDTSPARQSLSNADATLEIDGVLYEVVHSGSCVEVVVTIDDVRYTPFDRCDVGQYFSTIVFCVEFEERPEASSTTTLPDGAHVDFAPPRCLVEVPPVSVGIAGSDLTCVIPISGATLGPAEFIGPGVYVLALTDDFRMIPYSADGRPQDDIGDAALERLCEYAPPWNQSPVPTYLEIIYRMDESLLETDGVLLTDFGAVPEGFQFTAGDSEVLPLPSQVFTDTTHVTFGIIDRELGGEDWTLGDFELPAEIVAELTSGWACTDAWWLLVDVGATVLENDRGAISMRAISVAEANALTGYSLGAETDRQPGEPCPDHGQPRQGAVVDGAAVLHNITVRCVMDPAWFTLPDSTTLLTTLPSAGIGSENIVGNFKNQRDEACSIGGYVGPGDTIELSVGEVGVYDDPLNPLVLTIQPLPTGPPTSETWQGAAYELVITIGPPVGDPLTLDPANVTISWGDG